MATLPIGTASAARWIFSRLGLAPFVERQMEARRRRELAQVGRPRRQRKFERNAGRLAALGHPGAAHRSWCRTGGRCSRKPLGHAERSLVGELIDVRNNWAHQKTFHLRGHRPRARQRPATAARGLGRRARRRRSTRCARRCSARCSPSRRASRPGASRSRLEGTPQAGLKPWREVVTPHPDVASGRYIEAEFAADLAQVQRGEASNEYGDPVEFFRRTYLTDGLHPPARRARSGGLPASRAAIR